VIAALKNQLGDQVRFIIADLGDGSDPTNRELAQKYQIYGIPTYLFFDHQGELVDQHVGYIDPVDLGEMIAALIPR